MNRERKREMNRRKSRGRQERMVAAKAKGTHSRQEWLKMKRFFNNLCVCCGQRGWVQKDHIQPVFMEGSHSIRNVQPLCPKCNQMKGFWDIVDYRPLYCEKNGLVLPDSWKGESVDFSPPLIAAI